MDKYEYKVRADEIRSLISEGDYVKAAEIADTIDWRRVKSVMMLCTISDLYKINRRYEDSRDVLLLAYEKGGGRRPIVYSLCELSIKLEEYVAALEYYKEFVELAPEDSGRYVLKYKLYEAQEVSLEERIAVLEELKKKDYREKWAYELAYLYHRVGLESKCVEECDEMYLWFQEGRYVLKALELKKLHQPLTEEQEIRYELMRQNGSDSLQADILNDARAIKEEAKTASEEEEDDEFSKAQNVLTDPTQEIPGAAVEDDIQVKTVDVSQYNTVNLQRELAESMKAYMEEPSSESAPEITEEAKEPEETEETVSEQETPVLKQDTDEMQLIGGDMPVTDEGDVFAGNQPVEAVSEEVFFGNTEEVKVEDVVSELVEKDAEKSAEDIREQSGFKDALLDSTISNTGIIRTFHKSSGYDEMLSQEYDGQISLVVPEEEKVEKQITGQLSIEDVVAEWERIKKENEQKQLMEIRKKIRQHTDSLFTDFDEATKDGLLEKLEKAMIDAGGNRPKEIKISDIGRDEETLEVLEKVEDEEPEAVEEETEVSEVEETEETEVPEAEETEEETEAPEAETTEEAKAPEAEEKTQAREMSKAEREQFAPFIHHKKTRRQIVEAIDNISMASYTGNVVITGEEGTGTTALAKLLVKEIQLSDDNFSGKVAKISGSNMNRKDVGETLGKMGGGALIIESAAAMKKATAEALAKELNQEEKGLVILLTDKKEAMEKFLKKNEALVPIFNLRVDVEALDDQTLVKYAQKYALDQEYSIDDLGILALHTRIADMQTSDHEVTMAEIEELVDEAIYYADKKTPKHFFDILFGKRYDDEDMIILREKDFMHY